MELGECLERLQAARSMAVAVNDEYAARRSEIMEQIRPLLEALVTEYGDRLRETGEEVNRLEADARAMVRQCRGERSGLLQRRGPGDSGSRWTAFVQDRVADSQRHDLSPA